MDSQNSQEQADPNDLEGQPSGPGRVEAILGGWWKRGEEKFRRCRTMDLGLEEGVVVLDSPLAHGDEFELHLDIEAEWSVRLQATTVSSRPIFFGQQHLTRVSYSFPKTADRSMFALWLQQQLASKTVGNKDYLKPVERHPARQGEEPVIGQSSRLAFVEDRWRRALSSLRAKIPWREAAPVPNDRRNEHRGQVGLTLTVTARDGAALPAELLNVSFSGACLFIETAAVDAKAGKPWPVLGQKLDLEIPDASMLIGIRRCPVELIWAHDAKVADGDEQQGRAFGVRFVEPTLRVKRTFIGDLLRRLRYDSRQVRKELRFPLALPVMVRFKERLVAGQTVDLGAGGARLLLESTVETPSEGFIELNLPGPGQQSQKLTLSIRFLREVAGPDGGHCYAVAFRKGQAETHVKLSRWLASRMRVQTLSELVPGLSSAETRA